jgi:hypothetical protein
MNTFSLSIGAVALALCAGMSTATGQALERMPVLDPRPVLVAAIDSPSGTAHGVLVGRNADAITLRFKATSPIYIDVSTERRYWQPGCARLNISFWQDGVALPGAPGPRKQTIDMGINYCRDGLPPKALL